LLQLGAILEGSMHEISSLCTVSGFENCLEFGVEFQILEIILKGGLFEASSILLHLLVLE
jgi:hypothetical protein